MEYKTTKRISKEVIDEILEVKQKEGLTAESIVEKAKSKKSNLHNLFEWDDTKAGEFWRMQQARVLINEVKIIIEDKEYYAFENVTIEIKGKNETDSKKEYLTVEEIMNSKTLRAQMIKNAYARLMYWTEQHHQYSEFQPIFDAIKLVGQRLEKKKAKAKAVA